MGGIRNVQQYISCHGTINQVYYCTYIVPTPLSGTPDSVHRMRLLQIAGVKGAPRRAWS